MHEALTQTDCTCQRGVMNAHVHNVPTHTYIDMLYMSLMHANSQGQVLRSALLSVVLLRVIKHGPFFKTAN